MVAFQSGAVLPAASLNAAFNAYTINTQTGTTYTFVLSDQGGMVTASNASAQTYTVPPNSSVAFATGTMIEVLNIGSASVTLAPGSGVTVTGGLVIPAGGRAELVKISTNGWYSTVSSVTPGMVLIGTYSPSASSSFSIDNCFSSAYSVYDISCALTAAAGSPIISVRMRAAAADNSAASYDSSLIIDNPTTPASSLATGQTSGALLRVATTLSTARLHVINPAAASPTAMRSHYQAGITSPIQGFYSVGHNVSTAYDGITFIPASSTITGTIRVYGMAQ